MRVAKAIITSVALVSGLLIFGLAARAGAAQPITNKVYIWPGNLYQGNTSGNGLNLRQVGTGTFAIVPGPGTPPLGNASAQFSLGPGPGTGRVDIWANQFAGTLLRDITSMGYSTFLGVGDAASFSPVYQLPIFATPGGPSSTFTTLSFEPSNQGVAVPAGWSNWDALSGRWIASNAALSTRIPGGCQRATPCTFAQITSAFPDAVLHGVDPVSGIGGAALIVGTLIGPTVVAANDWSFGVNGVTTVFDFHTGPPPEGYWLGAADGGVFSFGDAPFEGSQANSALAAPIAGMAAASGGGYWLVGSDGTVFSHDARSFGSLTDHHLDAPIVGMAATPDGGGYYLVAADGGVFTFGDAVFRGSLGDKALDKPVVGIAVTPDNQGYYLVAADGGVFTFGDAVFRGSLGGIALDKPVVGMAVDAATSGYWLVAGDGGLFTFAAPFLGSVSGAHLSAPVVGMASTADDLGYRLVGGDGGVFCFGTAQFLGSIAGHPLFKPVIGMASIG